MRKIMWMVLVWALPAMGQSAPVDLREAAGCGPLKEQYRVKVDKTKHAVAQPEAGKALVYVIVEEYPRPQDWTYVGNITTRVGLDGNWVGANYGESYVSFAVEPGEHHLCTDWQSVLKSRQRLSASSKPCTARASVRAMMRMSVLARASTAARIFMRASSREITCLPGV